MKQKILRANILYARKKKPGAAAAGVTLDTIKAATIKKRKSSGKKK